MKFEDLSIHVYLEDCEVKVAFFEDKGDESIQELGIEEVPSQFVTVLMDQANMIVQKELRFNEFWKVLKGKK